MKVIFLLSLILTFYYAVSQQLKSNLCSGISNGFLPHPQDCGKFIRCSHQRSYEFQCPSSLIWHHQIKSCDYPYRAQCKSNINDHVISTKKILTELTKCSGLKCKSLKELDVKAIHQSHEIKVTERPQMTKENGKVKRSLRKNSKCSKNVKENVKENVKLIVTKPVTIKPTELFENYSGNFPETKKLNNSLYITNLAEYNNVKLTETSFKENVKHNQDSKEISNITQFNLTDFFLIEEESTTDFYSLNVTEHGDITKPESTVNLTEISETSQNLVGFSLINSAENVDIKIKADPAFNSSETTVNLTEISENSQNLKNIKTTTDPGFNSSDTTVNLTELTLETLDDLSSLNLTENINVKTTANPGFNSFKTTVNLTEISESPQTLIGLSSFNLTGNINVKTTADPGLNSSGITVNLTEISETSKTLISFSSFDLRENIKIKTTAKPEFNISETTANLTENLLNLTEDIINKTIASPDFYSFVTTANLTELSIKEVLVNSSNLSYANLTANVSTINPEVNSFFSSANLTEIEADISTLFTDSSFFNSTELTNVTPKANPEDESSATTVNLTELMSANILATTKESNSINSTPKPELNSTANTVNLTEFLIKEIFVNSDNFNYINLTANASTINPEVNRLSNSANLTEMIADISGNLNSSNLLNSTETINVTPKANTEDDRSSTSAYLTELLITYISETISDTNSISSTIYETSQATTESYLNMTGSEETSFSNLVSLTELLTANISGNPLEHSTTIITSEYYVKITDIPNITDNFETLNYTENVYAKAPADDHVNITYSQVNSSVTSDILQQSLLTDTNEILRNSSDVNLTESNNVIANVIVNKTDHEVNSSFSSVSKKELQLTDIAENISFYSVNITEMLKTDVADTPVNLTEILTENVPENLNESSSTLTTIENYVKVTQTPNLTENFETLENVFVKTTQHSNVDLTDFKDNSSVTTTILIQSLLTEYNEILRNSSDANLTENFNVIGNSIVNTTVLEVKSSSSAEKAIEMQITYTTETTANVNPSHSPLNITEMLKIDVAETPNDYSITANIDLNSKEADFKTKAPNLTELQTTEFQSDITVSDQNNSLITEFQNDTRVSDKNSSLNSSHLTASETTAAPNDLSSQTTTTSLTTQDPRLPFRALECAGDNNTRQFKALKCYQYYQCFAGWAFLMNCHEGWWFEGQQGQCVLDVNRKCEMI